MSDELVKRLRAVSAFGTANGGTTLDGLWTEAADRIEDLTAERDDAMAMQNVAYAAGYYQAECGLPEHENAVAALAELKAVEAERDRLREALLCGRRLWAIAQDDRVQLLIQLEQCEKRHE